MSKKYNNLRDCRYCLDKDSCSKEECRYKEDVRKMAQKPERTRPQMVCAMSRFYS